jgi:hypothetical protein
MQQVRATLHPINGNTIVHSLSFSTQTLLRKARVVYLQESGDSTFRIECSRMEAEAIYGAIALLILDLRRLLIELKICIEAIEIFDTDAQSRFVKFSLFDDRMIG